MSEFKNLVNIIQDESDYIDLTVNNFESKVLKTLHEVNDNIVNLMEDYLSTNNLKKVDLGFSLVNKAQIENLLRSSGYYEEVETFLDDQLALLDDVVKEYGIFDYKLQFTNISRQAIRTLIENQSVVWNGVGAQTNSQIYNGIYDSLVTDKKLSDAVVAVRDTIENTNLRKYAGTYANTEMMKFNRSLSAQASNQTGWDRYQFVGPIDAKISHEFCLKHVGDIMTMDEINEQSKIYGFDIFIQGGGYNCRHKWVNVSPDYKISQNEKTAIDQNIKIARQDKKKGKK